MRDFKGWIDWWMIPHFVLWAIIVGWVTWFFSGLDHRTALVIVLAGSITWEFVEYYREEWRGWRHERWNNRLLVDPITNTAGAMLGWWLVMHFYLGKV